ncbi:DUF4232 domain-containing protein [Streptomyces sp. NPDC003635]
MPNPRRAVPAVLAGALLLAACGTEEGDSTPTGSEGGPVSAGTLCPSDQPQYGAPTAEAPVATAIPSGTPSALPLPPADGTADDEVRITGLYAWGPDSGCAGADVSADFEVTNRGAQAATYTITFGFRGGVGGGTDHGQRTVESVGPGKTVKGTVVRAAESTGSPSDVSGISVVKVRSVPVAEASTASGPCPESGLHVYADQGDAAMGLRAVGLHLVNCGDNPYALNGYPEIELLDEDHASVDGVRILQGTARISTGLGDDTARPVTLEPGEAARATLAWRNTTQSGTPVNAPYARVHAKPGAAPVMVIPEFDLGTTGQLGVSAWAKDETLSTPQS